MWGQPRVVLLDVDIAIS